MVVNRGKTVLITDAAVDGRGTRANGKCSISSAKLLVVRMDQKLFSHSTFGQPTEKNIKVQELIQILNKKVLNSGECVMWLLEYKELCHFRNRGMQIF